MTGGQENQLRKKKPVLVGTKKVFLVQAVKIFLPFLNISTFAYHWQLKTDGHLNIERVESARNFYTEPQDISKFDVL